MCIFIMIATKAIYLFYTYIYTSVGANFVLFLCSLLFTKAHGFFVHADYCEELMSMSLKRLEKSVLALKESPKKNKHDIQTWLSAAVTFQQTCKDSVEGLKLSGELNEKISQKMDYLSQLGSNPLALTNRITENSRQKNTDRLLNEEQIFPSWVSSKDRKLLQAPAIKANAVVAKDGTGNYRTVAEAINAASGNRFVIYVKAGVYKEKIHTKKNGITLIGDGKYSTIITGSSSVAGGSSMPGSATFSQYFLSHLLVLLVTFLSTLLTSTIRGF